MKDVTSKQARYLDGGSPDRKLWKRHKARAERRRAKLDPEAAPTYGRFAGYAS